MDRNKKRGAERIPWALIVILFLLFPPAAVILLLVKLFAGDRESIQDNAPSLQDFQRVTVDTRINKPAAQEPVRKSAKSPSVRKSRARGLEIAGVILAVIGLFMMGNVIDGFDWEGLITALTMLIGGGAMLLKGRFLDRDVKRYANYLAIIGTQEAVPIDTLSRKSGYSLKQVEKDLRQMVENGYFGEGAYLNMELGYLFRNSEADRVWQEKQRAASAAAPKEAEEGYSGILRNIRRANDEIADPVLSAKIDQLEDITARIFRAMEQDPEKAKRMDTFLNYYLPTTQKLLDSYAQFEAAGVEGENLSQAKTRIASTMDMILKGFSHQLDELYKADAMDVDSDIRVMESMLRRDTRSVADDFGLGGSAVREKPEDS